MKRRCPWASDADGRFVKNHHSDKDAEKKSASAMQAVYTKTLNLLFGGAKQNGPNNNEQKISCISCVRTIGNSASGSGGGKCASCHGETCALCLQSCKFCSSQVCSNCSIEDQVFYEPTLRVCLGCRDASS